jgi:hypothetical protein
MRLLKTRLTAFVTLLAALTGVLSCGDSDDTPLGTEFVGDILGSTPGVVFEDSFGVSNDSSYVFYSLIDQQVYLEVGKQNGYDRASLMRVDFSSAGNDTLKTVSQAALRLDVIEYVDYVDRIRALFYQLGTEYNEGDSVAVLDTTTVIPDPDTGLDEREIALGTLSYPLPPELVQGWIRGDSVNNGIAVVYARDAGELLGFDSSEGTDKPSIQVFFEDGTQTNYVVTDDGIYTRPTETTDNLVLSDGYVRRIQFFIDLSEVDDSASVNEASVTFDIVPGSVFGIGPSVALYVPDSPDPNDPGFLTVAQLVTSGKIDESVGYLELPVTNVLLQILAGTVPDNGFVLKYSSENSEVRQAEFFNSSAAVDSLRPLVKIIYTTPAEFDQ